MHAHHSKGTELGSSWERAGPATERCCDLIDLRAPPRLVLGVKLLPDGSLVTREGNPLDEVDSIHPTPGTAQTHKEMA